MSLLGLGIVWEVLKTNDVEDEERNDSFLVLKILNRKTGIKKDKRVVSRWEETNLIYRTLQVTCA